MANKLVYSWADKLWHMNPPRKYIATRWAAYKTTIGHIQRQKIIQNN